MTHEITNALTDQQITELAKSIAARSPFDLRSKLAERIGQGFTVDDPTWTMLSRIAQTVWDARSNAH